MDESRLCPLCVKPVVLEGIDYEQHVQRTECPHGHRVTRSWNGPERGADYDPFAPYGWSPWTT